jgi:hypothetical protein
MIHLSLKAWSGQFEVDAVMRKIRRIIAYHVAQDVCVVVLDDGAAGLTPEVRRKLAEGWPEGKVLWSNTHPELGGPGKKSAAGRKSKWKDRR